VKRVVELENRGVHRGAEKGADAHRSVVECPQCCVGRGTIEHVSVAVDIRQGFDELNVVRGQPHLDRAFSRYGR
jgi:hypothetical protein